MTELVADAHIHICKDDWRFGIDLVFTWDDLGQLFSTKKLEHAIVLPMISNTDDSLEVNKEFFTEATNFEFRNKIWPYYWPHPDAVDAQFAQENNIAGVKYHPSISQRKIDNAPDVIKLAQECNVPLLVHCGRNQMSRINFLLTAARKEPDVTYIAAHLGGLANELILDALNQIDNYEGLDNLYLDTSGCMNPKILSRAIEVMGPDRILWGTDLPFFDFEITRFVLERTGIEASAMNKILYENVVSIHN